MTAENGYVYLVLRPEQADNPDYDLGIEVTVPSLVSRRPNLDPQHGGQGAPARSAIEAALTWPVPPPGSRLATIRPDADSLGAMAVLACRLSGEAPDPSLVRAIGRLDELGPAAWRHLEVLPWETHLLAAQAASRSADLHLNEKVGFLQRLLTRQSVRDELERWSMHEVASLRQAAKVLKVTGLFEGRCVLVAGAHPLAFDVGYRHAPVVLAYNPKFIRPWLPDDRPHRKWTIARADEHAGLDIQGLKEALCKREPGWGGPRNLVASPQGQSTRLRRSTILSLVERHLITGV